MHAITAHWANAFADVLLQEFDGLFNRFSFINGAVFNALYQATVTVGFGVPIIHIVDDAVWLVNGQNWAFS